MEAWLTCSRIILESKPYPQSWQQLSDSAKCVREVFTHENEPELYASSTAIHLGARSAAIDRQTWFAFRTIKTIERIRHNIQAGEQLGFIAGLFIDAARRMTNDILNNETEETHDTVSVMRGASDIGFAVAKGQELFEDMLRRNIPLRPPSLKAIFILAKEKHTPLPSPVVEAIKLSLTHGL